MALYDVAVRTSVVASAGAIIQLVPPAAALGTGRMVYLRHLSIGNTTATAFGVGLGIATAAAVTPATAGTIVKRYTGVDAAAISLVWSTFGTTPTAPTGFFKRLWIPASSLVILEWSHDEALRIPPAAVPLPFCVWNNGVGQVCDVNLSWEE